MFLKLGRSIGRRLVVRSAHRSKVGVRVFLHHGRVLRRDCIRDWRLRLEELPELLYKLEVLVLQVRLKIRRRVLPLQRLALARAHKSAGTKGRMAARGAGRRFRGDMRRRLDYVRVAVGGGRQQVGGLVLGSRTCTLIMSLPFAASSGFAMAEWLNMSKNCSSGRRAQAARPPGGQLRSCWRSRGGLGTRLLRVDAGLSREVHGLGQRAHHGAHHDLEHQLGARGVRRLLPNQPVPACRQRSAAVSVAGLASSPPLDACSLFARLAHGGGGGRGPHLAPMWAMGAPGATPSSNTVLSPPPIKSSSPFAASRHPPETGACRNRAPCVRIPLKIFSPAGRAAS